MSLHHGLQAQSCTRLQQTRLQIKMESLLLKLAKLKLSSMSFRKIRKKKKKTISPSRPLCNKVPSVLKLGKPCPEAIWCSTTRFSIDFSRFPLSRGSNFKNPPIPLSFVFSPSVSHKSKFQAQNGSIFQISPNENVNCDPKKDREWQAPRAHTSPSVTGILYCGLLGARN